MLGFHDDYDALRPSTKTSLSATLLLPMSFLVSQKALRLLLAISVSVWLAGGCLFGCGATAMAADVSSEAAVEGESCHAPGSHDCCAKPSAKPAKQTKINVRVNPNSNEKLAGVSSLPRRMGDCPLMIGATAVVSKSSSSSPELIAATTEPLPLAVTDAGLPQRHVVDPFLPNRGPTYLRCCVFLI